ncbi:hypothetical protein C8R48DRAFT_601909, partial [Suillus tomentosus]
QAAARAVLRHDAHIDGTHYHTQKPGGLHPSHIAFNSYTSSDEQTITQEAFADAALQDVFDALAMQDRLDGGISILMRCTGSEASESHSPEQFTIDLYITPHKYHEMPERIGGDVSALALCAANNHKKRCTNVRAALRKIINQKLVEITKDNSARMHWANYFHNVVQPYQVIVEGWPTNIPFINLSEVSSTLPDLDLLERKWRSGAVHWRHLEDEEFQ